MTEQGKGPGDRAGYVGWRASRRVVLKAAATMTAIAAGGGIAQGGMQRGSAQNQGAPATLARRWVESEQIGAFAAQEVDAPKTVAAEFPFYAVGAHWDGAVGYWPVVEFSFSTDGVTYGDPVQVAASVEDAGRPERDDRAFSHLAFTEGAQYIKYRTLDGDSNPTLVDGFALTYIDASAGPTPEDVFAPASLPTLERPPIISRAGWGANESYRLDSEGEIWPPEYQAVAHVIIHHTVTPNFQNPLTAIRSIYYYHAVERYWGDIGYNYLVDFNGNIYEGRHGGENVVGGHSYQYAYGSSGIGTLGDFRFQDATDDAQSALIAITAWVGRNLDPLGRADFLEVNNLPTICGHRDVNASTCPGDFLYADLPGIREAVNDVLENTESPPGEEVPPPFGEFGTGDNVITTQHVNLRFEPSFEATVIRTLSPGEYGAVIGIPRTNEEHDWYYIITANGEGYVSGRYIELAPKGNPPPARFDEGDFVRVVDGAVALRSRPGITQREIAYLPTGAVLEITVDSVAETGYRWYGVYHPTYKGGWIVQDFLEATEPPPEEDFDIGDRVVVNTDVLNLRSGPGTSFGVVAEMPGGTEGTVIDGPVSANGFTWWRLDTEFGTGWAAGLYLALADEEPPPVFQVGAFVQVIDPEGVNLRYAASTGSGIVAALPFETIAEVFGGPETGSGYTWYQLETGVGVGWAIANSLEETTEPAPPAVVFGSGDMVAVNVSTTLNLRDAPSRTATTIARLPDGTTGEVTSGTMYVGSDAWYRIVTSLGTGWVLAHMIVESDAPPPTGDFEIGDTVAVDVSTTCNLRNAPSRSARTIARLPNGTIGEVLDGPAIVGADTWYEIQTALGTGWVLQHLLVESDEPPPPDGFEIGDVVEIDVSTTCNVRSGPSRGATTIFKAPDGTVGEVVDGPVQTGSDIFYEIRTALGTGWVLSHLMVASDQPPPDSGIDVGDTVMVSTDALNLRSSPNTGSTVIATMPFDTVLEVIGGPTDSGGYTWWQVISDDYGTGWCAGEFLSAA
ncbi:MAG: SH3 domain-containing protein [Thermomicrobiales bacterium]